LNISIIILVAYLCHPGWSEKNELPSLKTLTVGYSSAVFNEVDVKDAQLAIEVWTQEMASLIHIKGKAIIISNYESMVSLINQKELDLVALPALDYLALKKRLDMEPVMVGLMNGQVYEEFVLVAHRRQGVSHLSHLKGKIIALQAPPGANAIPLLWLKALLGTHGLPKSETFFKQLKKVNKSSQAILPVFFRQCDAAIVTRSAFDTAMELNPQVGEHLTIIARSPQYLRGLVAVRQNLDEKTKQKIVAAALSLSSYPRGDQILKLFFVNKVVPFQPAYLETLEELARQSR
jgi:ABC-type phosphate/phosphonate transport system substrate-binding protein